jgi:hypothetical protein
MSTEPKQVPAWVLVVALSAIILAGYLVMVSGALAYLFDP